MGLFFAVKQGNFADKGAKCSNMWYNHSADVPLYSYGGVVLNLSRVIFFLDSDELHSASIKNVQKEKRRRMYVYS